MMTPEEYRQEHWDEDNAPEEEMTLNEALSIVDSYITFGDEKDNFREALEKVYSAAEDYNYFSNGESRQAYRASLTAKESRARQEGRKENRNYIEKAICKDNELTIYGDYKPSEVNELNLIFKNGDELHLEPITYGYWETPEPDYDREGNKLLSRVAICSNCQKPNRLPTGRYCSECGSWNKGHGKET